MPAYEMPKLEFTLLAAADLSAKQFFAVMVDSTGKAAVATAGAVAVGVLQNKPASGNTATIMQLGITKMAAGGAIAAGAFVAADANGRAKVAVAGAAASSSVVGQALTAAAALGELITVVLMPAGTVPTTPT